MIEVHKAKLRLNFYAQIDLQKIENVGIANTKKSTLSKIILTWLFGYLIRWGSHYFILQLSSFSV